MAGTPEPDVPVGDLLASLGVTGPSGPEPYRNDPIASPGVIGPPAPELPSVEVEAATAAPKGTGTSPESSAINLFEKDESERREVRQ